MKSKKEPPKKGRQMDNAGYKDAETGTELKKVEIQANGGGPSGANQTTTTCTPEVCRQARQRFQPPGLAESPWHIKKTYFFIGTIVIFIIWIIIYSTLSHLDLV